MAHITIKDLYSTEYEHPLDRIALETLRKIPLFPKILELCDIPQNSIARMELLGSNLRVNERQLPSVYKIFRKACETLEVPEPQLYVSSYSGLNAYTACPDKPIICIFSDLLDLLTEEELCFVIGHELSHIKSQHITYQSLGAMLANNLLEAALSMIPGLSTLSQPAIFAINYAYYEWYRAAEYSCDRGGFLACQNFEASCSALMKLAGYSNRYAKELNLEEFIAQASSFHEASSENMGKLQKIILSNGRSHPWSVSRVHELIKFKESGLYQDILDRTAPKCPELPSIDVSGLSDKTKEAAAKTTAAAKDAANKTKDAAKNAMAGLSGKFGGFGKKAEGE